MHILGTIFYAYFLHKLLCTNFWSTYVCYMDAPQFFNWSLMAGTHNFFGTLILIMCVIISGCQTIFLAIIASTPYHFATWTPITRAIICGPPKIFPDNNCKHPKKFRTLATKKCLLQFLTAQQLFRR